MTLNRLQLDHQFVAAYYTVTRSMIQQYSAGTEKEGRVARRILNKLHFDGWLNKTQMQVVNPENGRLLPSIIRPARALNFSRGTPQSCLAREMLRPPQLAASATLGCGRPIPSNAQQGSRFAK